MKSVAFHLSPKIHHANWLLLWKTMSPKNFQESFNLVTLVKAIKRTKVTVDFETFRGFVGTYFAFLFELGIILRYKNGKFHCLNHLIIIFCRCKKLRYWSTAPTCPAKINCQNCSYPKLSRLAIFEHTASLDDKSLIFKGK